MALISTVLADFIFLLAEAIQQKPVIPAFRGAEIWVYVSGYAATGV